MIEAEDIQICVGGWSDGRVIVYFNPVGDSNEKGAARLVTGDRLGDSDRRNIVDISTAASAVHELIDDGNSLHYLWERQDWETTQGYLLPDTLIASAW